MPGLMLSLRLESIQGFPPDTSVGGCGAFWLASCSGACSDGCDDASSDACSDGCSDDCAEDACSEGWADEDWDDCP